MTSEHHNQPGFSPAAVSVASVDSHALQRQSRLVVASVDSHALQRQSRLDSIDLLRGLVMLLMLLDHVRERFYLHQQVADPMDIQHTEPALYVSRLLAHLCAPVFILLTGLSAALYQQSGRPLSGFLVKRGLVLLALELTLVNFSWLGSYNTLYLQVIWVIGLCMLVLALLHQLPRPLLWLVAIACIAGHNLLTPISFAPTEAGYSLWTVLHDRGYLYQGAPFAIKISYPLLPWIGVIVLGYLAGTLFAPGYAARQRQRQLWRYGGIALGVLVLLRAGNFYGETLPWQWQPTLNLTLMDFFNFTKYPPSLAFLLLSLGLAALLLSALERYRLPSGVHQLLRGYGGAPMFFYLLHLYALLLLQWAALAWFGPTHQLSYGAMFSVSAVWQLWLISLLLALGLYAPTRWFAGYKQRSRARWVRYL